MQQTDNNRITEYNRQSDKDRRAILIAATGSGCGKTTFVCGLLWLLKRRGFRPCAFKCGPDYIDPSFHRRVLGVPSYNLDPFFTEENVLQKLYETHSRECGSPNISIIEGVMGYYDGLGFTDEASTYSVAKALDVPVILLVDCKGMGHSVLPVVEGFAGHRTPSMIQGIVFNRMAPSLYEKAAEEVRALGIMPLGYLPENRELRLESRHLGLVMADEVQDFTQKIEGIANRIEETVDVDSILKLAQNVGGVLSEQIIKPAPEKVSGEQVRGNAYFPYPSEENVEKSALRIAVARDEAFCFLYEDNLNFLRAHGAEIVPFSPLHDQTIPENCDALYLSGGYPELYAGELFGNHSMRQDVKNKIERGLPCIAECGGFLYLHEQMESQEKEGVNGKRMAAAEEPRCFQEMVGIIPAKAVNCRRKGHFGYIEVTLEKDCLLGEKGDSFRAHEFHYWESDMEQTDLHVRKPGNGSTWTEGFCTETLYAGFPHLYFYGCPKVGEHFLAASRRYHDKRRVM